ncbi:BMC domain-containing protein [Paenibacillus sp. BR2-3]|uniref:BMC domain-containing protein n=1 Tax=Paenibacillus sp. BR2-3 TaxID=3048494 RepID=UPI003977332C
MITNALGLIEVNGYPAALEAADTCLKSSNVTLIGYEKVQAGLVVVKITGDVGAVKAAVDAARISVARLGEVVAATVIARPAEGTGSMVYSPETVMPTDESRVSESAPQDFGVLAPQPEENHPLDGGLDAAEEETEPVMPQQGQDLTSVEGEAGETPPDAPDDKVQQPIITCNLCGNPLCTRKKGQPASMCLHYRQHSPKKNKDGQH